MITTELLNPSLQWPVEAFQSGAITREQATACIKAWPAYLPAEMAMKARALRMLATTQPEAGPSGKKAAQG
jgi:hypothetical protein